ncbi:hypothetical protein Cgig2_017324 [Carnegiea gigantea]|uniref:L-gulonolactone oxidase n=1 Tax=Carnegiea gigantea TaxID=171969 RepID=A0A9Q1K5K2_9CARY|nr:hypothetical protein Cgig2_017324 [Carnegiea gigantea]
MSSLSCINLLISTRPRPRPTLVLSCLLLLLFTAGCSPPEDPIKCLTKSHNCTITTSYGTFPDRATCRAADVVYPSSEDELVSVVAAATKIKRKMKVATRYSHSIPKLVCPDGEDGLLISTKNLNKIHEVDPAARTMTVDTGVTLRQLINEAAKAGLALPYSPYWWGLTVGGMLGTGAHGSSLWGRGSAVHDYVVEIRIVSPGEPKDGFVKVRTLDERIESHAELDAAKVSLGVLGVISQVTFRLEPLFKRSITYVTKDDIDLGDQALEFGKQHEFADLTWYPSQHKVMYRIDDRVPNTTRGNGVYDFTGFRAIPSFALAIVRSTEEGQESKGDAEGKCRNSALTSSLLSVNAFGLTNNGYQNRVQASGTCLHSLEDGLITACPFDPRVKGEFFHQTTFSIGMSKVKAFIEDVQHLVSLAPNSLCGVELYNGILMRYVKASSAYLGKSEDGIDFDITYYRSKDPLTPRLYEDILEEIEQMAVFKYGGLPHWGKNRNLAFKGVINKYKNGKEFLRVKERFDPLGLFSNEWTNQVLGLEEGLEIFKQGCALEGLCICSEDRHCASKEGYFCRSGWIYKEARICVKNFIMPKLVCPGEEDGLLISTKNQNKIHKVETVAGTMMADTGVTLRQLINEAAEAGLALPYSPYWWGLMVGAMLRTGEYGSSTCGRGSAVHDCVVEIRIVSPAGPKMGSLSKVLMSSSGAALIRSCLLLLLVNADCSPPDYPIKCLHNNHDCTITNIYGTFPDRSTCHVAGVLYPSSEDELVSFVADATKIKRKMKIHKVDKVAGTMTVDTGVTLRQLINEAAEAGLALPNSPYWWGPTVGGMLGTGAHGSSLWGRGSAVHDYVVEIRIVCPGGPEDGFVKVRTLNESHAEFDAAKVSLGVLGVISQDDNDLEDEALDFGNQHEFADLTWYPSQRKVLYRIDDRVPSTTPGDGLNDFIGFRSAPLPVLASIRLLGYILTGHPVVGYQNRLQSSGTCLDSPENLLLTACPFDPRVKGEFFHQTTFSIGLSKVKGFLEDVQHLVSLAPKSLCGVELYNGILMRYVKASSAYLGEDEDGIDVDITHYRSKDPILLYEDILEEIEQMALFKYDGLPHWGKNRSLAFKEVINKYKNGTEFLKACFQMNGPIKSLDWKEGWKFLKKDVPLKGYAFALKTIIVPLRRATFADQDGFTRKQEFYGGLPHWGKNRNLAFRGVINKYENGAEFLRVKERFDPLGLFSNEWTNRVLGLEDYNVENYQFFYP